MRRAVLSAVAALLMVLSFGALPAAAEPAAPDAPGIVLAGVDDFSFESFSADYSVEDLPTNPWIHQPFEAYDSLTPEKLLAKWKI